MKENLKMMGGLEKIGAREHHLSKSEGDSSTDKNEKEKKNTKKDKILRLYPTVLRGKGGDRK